jgi:hypothetical protein
MKGVMKDRLVIRTERQVMKGVRKEQVVITNGNKVMKGVRKEQAVLGRKVERKRKAGNRRKGA